MENIRTLIRLQHPELADINIIEEGDYPSGVYYFKFENGKEVRVDPYGLIDDILGLILKTK